MYEAYWQLTEKPFGHTADTRFYYPGESHQAALLKLRYAVENRCAAALLAGPAGTGKTLLLRLLARMLGEEYSPVVHLTFPQMPAAELLAFLADQLHGSPVGSSDGSIRHSLRRIEELLEHNATQQRHAVVMLDEAHLLRDPAAWEMLRLLLNIEHQGRPGITLILCGQTGVLASLDRMPAWEQRLAVKCLLRPLSADETAAYVQHRLRTAGAQRSLFEPEALAALHQLARGIPREIDRLCDLALLIGFAEERTTIGAEQIESVCQELVNVTPD